MASHEVKVPVRGVTHSGSVGTQGGRTYPLSASTLPNKPLNLANEFTGGNRLAGRPKVPQKPRQTAARVKARRAQTPVSLRTRPRVMVP